MKRWQKIILTVSITMIVIGIIFVFNQLVQLYQTLASLHPYLAWIVVGCISLILLSLLIRFLVNLARLPRQVRLADGAGPEEYQEYLALKLEQLRANPNLNEENFDWQNQDGKEPIDQIRAANQVLESIGQVLMKEEASAVFLTTAVSQNGSLDSLTVLVALIKMVWQLIKLYDVRPSLPKILTIYGQVFTTVLMTRSIEDMDLIEDQIEPLVTSLLGGSIVSMVPGTVSLANVVVNSIVEGAINALLTLRVGIITMDYLGTVEDLEKHQVKRQASLEATKLLGSIIKDNGKRVIKVFTNAVKNTGLSATEKVNPSNWSWNFSRNRT